MLLICVTVPHGRLTLLTSWLRQIISIFDVCSSLWELSISLLLLGKGVKPGLSRSDTYQLPLAVPPLAEQHRIVAKVDALMALCDQLEAAKTEREQSRDRLVAASLHRLNSPADTAETDAPDLPARQADAVRDHARFVFNHLPRLTTRPEHIKQLRQTHPQPRRTRQTRPPGPQ